MKIEEYGFIGDLETAALVGANGSIDWLCLPNFSSEACFAALLGTGQNGHWQIAPAGPWTRARQRYRGDTLILETEFETAEGAVRLIDFMPPADHRREIIRIVEGIRGSVALGSRLVIRFDHGQTMPWVQRREDGLAAIAGPNALMLRADVEMHGTDDFATCSDFRIAAGERKTLVLSWHRSHEPPPRRADPFRSLADTEKFWREWCSHCTYQGDHREAVLRSLITLKALTFQPTGGIVAAPTTSLPEQLGGVRNWDYRYCWLRDATFTLFALLEAGYQREAADWGDWLLRAVAGTPAQLQMLYGVAGERRLTEFELPHLCGYENSRPVRIGNNAARQFQLDVYGEVVDAMHLRRELGLRATEDDWHLQRRLIEFVVEHWREPDEGIWEVRGPRRHFTHSKFMAWAALDRGIKAVEQFALEGDLARWQRVRAEIHAEVCARSYHPDKGTFMQHYDSDRLDASVLLMPLVGFLPVSDPRVVRTVQAIRRELMKDGLVQRYRPETSAEVDGLPPGEGAFLPCSFWLVDCLGLLGETEAARALFGKLLSLRTPLGLLSEEYDGAARRLVGNFPQAFSHVALINSAQNLARHAHQALERGASPRQKPAPNNRAGARRP